MLLQMVRFLSFFLFFYGPVIIPCSSLDGISCGRNWLNFKFKQRGLLQKSEIVTKRERTVVGGTGLEAGRELLWGGQQGGSHAPGSPWPGRGADRTEARGLCQADLWEAGRSLNSHVRRGPRNQEGHFYRPPYLDTKWEKPSRKERACQPPDATHRRNQEATGDHSPGPGRTRSPQAP